MNDPLELIQGYIDRVKGLRAEVVYFANNSPDTDIFRAFKYGELTEEVDWKFNDILDILNGVKEQLVWNYGEN